MATKRPLCNYAGEIQELAASDTLPDISAVVSLPTWKIIPGEIVNVGDRQEYCINSGTFINAGTLSLGDGSILLVRA